MPDSEINVWIDDKIKRIVRTDIENLEIRDFISYMGSYNNKINNKLMLMCEEYIDNKKKYHNRYSDFSMKNVLMNESRIKIISVKGINLEFLPNPESIILPVDAVIYNNKNLLEYPNHELIYHKHLKLPESADIKTFQLVVRLCYLCKCTFTLNDYLRINDTLESKICLYRTANFAEISDENKINLLGDIIEKSTDPTMFNILGDVCFNDLRIIFSKKFRINDQIFDLLEYLSESYRFTLDAIIGFDFEFHSYFVEVNKKIKIFFNKICSQHKIYELLLSVHDYKERMLLLTYTYTKLEHNQIIDILTSKEPEHYKWYSKYINIQLGDQSSTKRAKINALGPYMNNTLFLTHNPDIVEDRLYAYVKNSKSDIAFYEYYKKFPQIIKKLKEFVVTYPTDALWIFFEGMDQDFLYNVAKRNTNLKSLPKLTGKNLERWYNLIRDNLFFDENIFIQSELTLDNREVIKLFVRRKIISAKTLIDYITNIE